ncbi:MAG: class I SAM-dependent methyltransferase [Candidatus Pacearchaeota archaeon]|jgi:2-polyprenyl-3-methyl-5-hydroxy-6-metoxy-1,4-benzoquinol methylase
MEKNTPELWDDLWDERSEQEDFLSIEKEEASVRWLKIEKKVNEKFDFKNLKVIEIGAGAGINAILFAKRGSKVTILDYSQNALDRSKQLFKKNKLKARFVLADALNLKKNLSSKYDLSMSFGLAEHFTGEERTKIIKSHFDLINDKGLVLISVPNKANLPYRLNKIILGILKKWKFGEEYPFSRSEFLKICNSLSFKKVSFIGSSFPDSFRFINPILLIKKLSHKPTSSSNIKKEKPTIFDDHFGYALVLVGEKG